MRPLGRPGQFVEAHPTKADETDAEAVGEMSGLSRLGKTAGMLWEANGKRPIRTRSVHYPKAEVRFDLVGTQILPGDHFRDPPICRGAADMGWTAVAQNEQAIAAKHDDRLVGRLVPRLIADAYRIRLLLRQHTVAHLHRVPSSDSRQDNRHPRSRWVAISLCTKETLRAIGLRSAQRRAELLPERAASTPRAMLAVAGNDLGNGAERAQTAI
jgi:hypothetical protein